MNLSFQVLTAVVDRVALCVVQAPCSTELAKNSENVLPPSSGLILVHFLQHNLKHLQYPESPRILRQHISLECSGTRRRNQKLAMATERR